jgi:hypothetical protein
MSVTRLTTYWSAAEAYAVIAFLDALHDQLWETYGDQVTEMFQDVAERDANDRQTEMPFDDEIDF